jgi:dTDP-4-dehydrorhamnose reductase
VSRVENAAQRILLLAPLGQVGFALQRSLAPLGNLMTAGRRGADHTLDLSDLAGVQGLLNTLQPTTIVNAAAYTKVDLAESESAAAEQLNVALPELLGAWCANHAARLVHFSTDYVFAGSVAEVQHEGAPTAPAGVYARTKFAGEQAIQASGAAQLIFRLAGVYAERGQNFLLTMLRLAKQHGKLRVVDDQFTTPTPADWIASATSLALADWWRDADAQRRSGIYHLTASSGCTWHAFATAILNAADQQDVLPAASQVPIAAISTAEFNAKAPRPAYSKLDGSKLMQAFGLRLPEWERGLREVMARLAELR